MGYPPATPLINTGNTEGEQLKVFENIFAGRVSEEKELLFIKMLLVTAKGNSEGITVRAQSLREETTAFATSSG